MAEFTDFLHVLPDPEFSIGDAGQPGGTLGQGFVNVKLTNQQAPIQDRTIGGKLIQRTFKYPKWIINMSYNPMTRAQFEPINNFLMQKRGSLVPFYVSLPQYRLPKNSDFADWVPSNLVQVTNATAAGVTSLEIKTTGWSADTYGIGLPGFGDLFTVYDANDSLQPKAYMVTRVETYDDYQSTNPPVENRPTSGSIRIHFSPGLQKSVFQNTLVFFDHPKIQVTQMQDIQEHSLGSNELYAFSLKLQETLY